MAVHLPLYGFSTSRYTYSHGPGHHFKLLIVLPSWALGKLLPCSIFLQLPFLDRLTSLLCFLEKSPEMMSLCLFSLSAFLSWNFNVFYAISEGIFIPHPFVCLFVCF